LDRNNRDDRLFLLKALLHSADISNPVKKFNISKYWSYQLSEEFFKQGDKEKEMNMPISNFMNRAEPNVPKMTSGFITYIVKPLYSKLVVILDGLDPFFQQLEENAKEWNRLLEEGAT